MKKLLSLLLVVALAVTCLSVLTACDQDPGEISAIGKIALVTDVGTIDDKSFNQGAWTGVVNYAKANDLKKSEYKYFKPSKKDTADYVEAIDLAVEWGAKTVVCPGFLFEPAVWISQTKHPLITFVILDGAPQDGTYTDFTIKSNTVAIKYAEEESGFLAGYAAVKTGFTKLGFLGGMAVPAVQAFGYGYLQGADYAAVEMDLAKDAVTVAFEYTGNFELKPENITQATTMYSKSDVIFVSAGGVGGQVMGVASKLTNKYVIGVDVDQKADGPDTVITSATKGLADSVKIVLDAKKADKLSEYGGKETIFSAKNNGVGLPADLSSLKDRDGEGKGVAFTKAMYDSLFSKLVAGTVKPVRVVTPATGDVILVSDLVEDLKLTKVKVSL